jgi:UrcA family protein
MLKTILTTVLLAAAVPAVAQPSEVAPQIHVTYADLDLRRAADVRQFDRRLRGAIETICGDAKPGEGPIAFSVLRCRKAAYAQIADQRAAALAAANAATQLALNAAR